MAAAALFDADEARSPDEREAAQFRMLRETVRHAIARAPAFARHLDGVDPDAITDRGALARLPLLRKSELSERESATPPLGGLNATPLAGLKRVFVSPGPIFEPQGERTDWFRFARAFHAAGFRAGDLIHNAFSYHLTPAGFMVEGAAELLGCPVIPAGTGPLEQQVAAIRHLHPVAYVGTPSFLRTLLHHVAEAGVSAAFAKALVSGEAFPRALAEALETEHGISAFQCYATADLGLIAYESSAREGLIVDEEVVVEIVRPGTGDPVPDGEVGEVVVTLFNPDWPLIRFATGDLSAVLAGPSPCGRSGRRLRGWLGRADQTTKVRGLFVHPGQVAEIVRRHDEVGRARLVVERQDHEDRMTFECEVGPHAEGFEMAVESSIRAVTGLRGTVSLLDPGQLENDGRVIVDRREVG